MKNESRVIVRNLPEATALEMAKAIRVMAKAAKVAAQIEIDNPDPPDLLEEEFQEVSRAFANLDEMVGDSVEYWGEECDTPAKVQRDLKQVKKTAANIGVLYNKVNHAIATLETAAKKLAKK